MVNSGVRNVGVIAQKNYHSLMDHLGSGKEWDLHTRNNGLFILPPFLTRENGGEYSGVLEALRANFDYLRRSTPGVRHSDQQRLHRATPSFEPTWSRSTSTPART